MKVLALVTIEMENLEQEIWKDVVGYEGYYLVSNMGNVKSLSREICDGRIRVGKPKKKTICKGYHRIRVNKDREQATLLFHRVVALAFMPNPENKPQINHINGIKTDNRVENLEWCTGKENVIHSWDIGLSNLENYNIGDTRRGVTSAKAKMVINLETGIFYDSARQVSLNHNINLSTLYDRLNGVLVNNTPFVRC